jgi:hypothetical protein
MRITVAVVGDPAQGTIAEGDWDRSWEEREKIELDVTPDETLAHVLERAAHEFGVVLPQRYLSGCVFHPRSREPGDSAWREVR